MRSPGDSSAHWSLRGSKLHYQLYHAVIGFKYDKYTICPQCDLHAQAVRGNVREVAGEEGRKMDNPSGM